MKACAPTLSELQRAISRNLLRSAGVDAVSDVLDYVAADGLEPHKRLGIYDNTATSTLVKALQLSFPAIQSLVGTEFFEGAARLFIEASPPQSAWLDAYGSAFPDFLAQMPEAASLAYLPDTARLEWAVNTVLHAPDMQPLDLERLAQQAQAKPADIVFVPHPAVRLLQSNFPVDTIWRAVLNRDDGALGALDLAEGPVWLRVLRTPVGVDVGRLEEPQWRFATALFAGRPLHAALEDAASSEAQAWLGGLLADGCFAAIDLGSRTPDSTLWSWNP
ncbi:DNA-binding domain-containing protein [Ralstonia sp. SET104]|uniref:HvfC/BufC N-terminal domain-containing protein n=1 Tax=Ralstonia sp. SET104 TaxID=2448774 RepID=UPI000F589EA5|nr:DNA-binding domain-containing protein [Ralstonia sp. SET104]GCB05280.1 DUF2063 domain-containing protein [Ralstonia sp. SET104]